MTSCRVSVNLSSTGDTRHTDCATAPPTKEQARSANQRQAHLSSQSIGLNTPRPHRRREALARMPHALYSARFPSGQVYRARHCLSHSDNRDA